MEATVKFSLTGKSLCLLGDFNICLQKFETCNYSTKKYFKESLKGELFDTLETVDSYIEVETIIDQMKN